MTTVEVIQLLKSENIKHWQISDVLGIHETTISRWFRYELSVEQINKILFAVENIKLSKEDIS